MEKKVKPIEDKIQSTGFHSEQEKVYVNLIFSGMKAFREITIFMRAFNLTEPQYNILRILRGSHPITLLGQDIQSRMIHNTSNTTRLIDKLIDKKFVKRFKDKDDKRMIHHMITKKGLLLLNDIDPLLIKHCKETIVLSKQKLSQLSVLLDDLTDTL